MHLCSTFLSRLRLMLVGIWLGLHWVLFYFFDHLCYRLAKFKTSNCSGQRSLSSALPVRRTVSQGRGVGAAVPKRCTFIVYSKFSCFTSFLGD